MIFKNRHEAGMKLAKKLEHYKNNKYVVILAIPRGGVEVGYEIARFLNAELDVIVTKKIGMPGDEEFAIGSIGPDKRVTLNEETIRLYNVHEDELENIKTEIGDEIERRYRAYKGKYKLENLRNKTAILTDDGIATGFTTKAAIGYIKSQNPKKTILAVPVAPAGFAKEIKKEVDEFVCLHSPKRFFSVSQFYESFPQLTDEEVKSYLKKIKNQTSL